MNRDYYQILGVPSNARLHEIKKAFREKAKDLHPDINTSENASQQFISIHEAYQILSDHKKRYMYDLRYHTRSQVKSPKHPGPKKYDPHFDNWVKDARDTAGKHAHMGYSDFLESSFYKTASAVSNVIAFLAIGGGIVICLFPVGRYWMIHQSSALYALLYCIPVGLALIASGMAAIRS